MSNLSRILPHAVRGTSLADHLSKDDSSTIGAIVLPWKFTLEVRAPEGPRLPHAQAGRRACKAATDQPGSLCVHTSLQ